MALPMPFRRFSLIVGSALGNTHKWLQYAPDASLHTKLYKKVRNPRDTSQCFQNTLRLSFCFYPWRAPWWWFVIFPRNQNQMLQFDFMPEPNVHPNLHPPQFPLLRIHFGFLCLKFQLLLLLSSNICLIQTISPAANDLPLTNFNPSPP